MKGIPSRGRKVIHKVMSGGFLEAFMGESFDQAQTAKKTNQPEVLKH